MIAPSNIRSNSRVQRACLWIKEYAHVLKVIGGCFFGLALICGVIWIAGKDIEPVAFVMGLISSLFFSLPSIAAFVVPDRKPVRYMNYEEILSFIQNTDASTDWHGVQTNWASERFLKEDPRLRFRSSAAPEDVQNETFVESWANKHPDPNAKGYFYNLIYDGSLIDRFILVAVDGSRADIPLPDVKTGEISRLNYQVGKILDTQGTLDEYIRRSGLTVAVET